MTIAAGTRLAAELQSTIDVRKAKVGDEVVLKTTEAIKAEGRAVVKKGARLIGRVTEVSKKTQANGESSIGILFDRLESGSLEVSIAASIASISKSQASALKNDQATAGIDAGGNSSASARATTSGQRTSPGNIVGGVAGGVTNSVGGIVNATSATTSDVLGNTAAAVGSTINTSGSAAGGATSTVGRSLGGIRISESADASASGGSVLSLRGENLRVEKGTTFILVFTQAARGGTSQ